VITAANAPVGADTDVGLEINSEFTTIEDNEIQNFETQISDVTGDANLESLLAINDFEENSDAQSAVAKDDDGDILGDAIFGSIAAADDESDVAEIDVSAGNYDEDGSLIIDSDDVTVSGPVAGTAEIENTDGVNLASSDAVVFENFDLADDATIDTDGGASEADITIRNVDLGDSALDITDADAVTIENVVVGDVTSSTGIDFDTGPLAEVTIDDVSITTDSVGVDLDQNVEGDATLREIDVTGDEDDTDGIVFSGLINADENTYEIEDNDLTELGNGTGIELEDDEGDNGIIELNGNVIEGGSELIGVDYNLPQAEDVSIQDNVVIGDDVAGGGQCRIQLRGNNWIRH